MQYDPFECFVCLRGYNLAECLPRMLPHCGHTICCQCLEELLKSTRPKCPLDNKEFSPHDQTSHGQATVEDFPINFALRNFLEENSKWEVCKIHQKKVELVCLSDKSCLCAYCALFNGHQGHDVKPMEEIKTSLGEDVGKLETILNDLDSYYREADFGLETEKKNLLKIVNDQFSGLISIVNKKRLEISNEVQLFFRQEQTKLTGAFGGDSEMRSEILRKLDGCRGFTNYDIVTKLQEVAEISEMLNKCQTIKQEQEGVCKQKQEDMIVILNEFLDAQNYIETQLKESSEKLLNDLYSLREGTLQRTESCIRDYGAAECFEVESCIQIDTSNEYLEILATNKIPEKLIVDPQEWRDAREVRLTLHKFAFEKKDVDILRFIWSQFDTIHSIRIFAEHQDNIKENDLDNLFNLIFSNLHELQQIRLDISWSKIGSRSITWLTENVLSKASKLKHLNFKLYGTDVNDEAIKALAESFPHYTHGLESFSINLGVTAVTEQAVTHLFKGMPAVKIFKLGLSETKASDQCLQAFAEGMLQTMVSLEVLQLYLRDTEITDEGILRLIGCLPDIKRLQLSLETTKVTDKSIEKLLENKLGKMKSLKNLYLNLKDSQVSQKMITQVDQVQKKYSM